MLFTVMLQLININTEGYPLSFHRDTFLEQYYWEWITSSLVHVNWTHWLLNILNFWALMILFHSVWTVSRVAIIFICSSFVIIVSLYLFSTEVTSYMGMSGVLYTFAVFGSLKTYQEQKIISIIVLLYISAKLFVHDWVNHIMAVDIILIDVDIITDVHWYGAVFGLIYFFYQI